MGLARIGLHEVTINPIFTDNPLKKKNPQCVNNKPIKLIKRDYEHTFKDLTNHAHVPRPTKLYS